MSTTEDDPSLTPVESLGYHGPRTRDRTTNADIERMWPAISALHEYFQRTGDLCLGAPLSPIVRAVLLAMRDMEHTDAIAEVLTANLDLPSPRRE